MSESREVNNIHLQPLSTCLSVANTQQQKYFAALYASDSSEAKLTIYTIFWQLSEMLCHVCNADLGGPISSYQTGDRGNRFFFFFIGFNVELGHTNSSYLQTDRPNTMCMVSNTSLCCNHFRANSKASFFFCFMLYHPQ